jgi:hypothetical protein
MMFQYPIIKGTVLILMDQLKICNILHIVLSGRGPGGFALTESSKYIDYQKPNLYQHKYVLVLSTIIHRLH